MNSLEYIQKLREEFPVEKSGRIPDLSERLIAHLGDRLPKVIKHKIKHGTINLAEIKRSEPQAFVKEVSENDYAIVIHSGLSEFLYRVIRAISTRLVDSSLDIEPGSSFDDTVRIVSEIFWWLQETGESFGPDYDIHDNQKKIASILTTEVESFFLAHEMGHIILPKEDKLSFEKVTERLLFGDYKGYIQNSDHPHTSEFLSDAVAASIVLGIYTNSIDSNTVLNQIRYAGVEIGLMIFSGLEELGFHTSNSHPSFEDRINNIRYFVKHWTNDEEQWQILAQAATSFEPLYKSILKNISNPSEDQIQYYESSAMRLMNSIDDCLNRHSITLNPKPQNEEFIDVKLDSGEIVKMPMPNLDFGSDSITPNYGQFYIDVSDLLGEGYSHIFFKKIAKEFRKKIKLSHEELVSLEFQLRLLDHDQRLKILNENEELFLQLKEFQKSKLLIGFFSRQANPSGEYFFRSIYGE